MRTIQPRLIPAQRASDVRETPADLFARFDAEFGFTLDACALPTNAKCDRFFTPDDDGLRQGWAGETVWMNPPYSKCRLWVEKAVREAAKGATVVALLPASTDTHWFHDVVVPNAEVRFLRGRVRFVGQTGRCPFGLMVAVFRPKEPGQE